MSEITNDYINKIASKLAEALYLLDWNVSKENFETIAQNYFGVLIPIVLKGKHEDNEVSFQIVLKLAPTDERFRVSGALTLFFGREMFMYATVLKTYRKVQENFSPSLQFVIPTCYYVSNVYCNEVIAMADMRQEGYQPFTSSCFLNLNHIQVSLKSLAMFHALSFITRQKYKDKYEEYTEICKPMKEENNKRFMEILRDRLVKALSKFRDTPYVSLLMALNENCAEYVEAVAKKVKATCICHGDIWKENIMFKYQDTQPISACLIDYQTARTASPAYDLLYLIISSTHMDLRYENYTKLLDYYYENFTKTLQEANLTSDTVYSRTMLDYDLRVVGPACFITANTGLWLSSGLQEDGHVKSKKVLVTDDEKTEAVEEYVATVKGIMDDFVDYKYFSIDQSGNLQV